MPVEGVKSCERKCQSEARNMHKPTVTQYEREFSRCYYSVKNSHSEKLDSNIQIKMELRKKERLKKTELN